MKHIIFSLGLLFSSFAFASSEIETTSWTEQHFLGYSIISLIKVMAAISILMGVLLSIKSFRKFIIYIYLKFELNIIKIKNFFLEIFKAPIFNPIKKIFQSVSNVAVAITRKIRAIPIKYHLGLLLAVITVIAIMPNQLKEWLLMIPYTSERAITFTSIIASFSSVIVLISIFYCHHKDVFNSFENIKDFNDLTQEQYQQKSWFNRHFILSRGTAKEIDKTRNSLSLIVLSLSTLLFAYQYYATNMSVYKFTFYLLVTLSIGHFLAVIFKTVKFIAWSFTFPFFYILSMPQVAKNLGISFYNESGIFIFFLTCVAIAIFCSQIDSVLNQLYANSREKLEKRLLKRKLHPNITLIQEKKLNSFSQRKTLKWSQNLSQLQSFTQGAFLIFAWYYNKAYFDSFYVHLLLVVGLLFVITSLGKILSMIIEWFITTFSNLVKILQPIQDLIAYVSSKIQNILHLVFKSVFSWKIFFFLYAIAGAIGTCFYSPFVQKHINEAFLYLGGSMPSEYNLMWVRFSLWLTMLFSASVIGFYINKNLSSRSTKEDSPEQENDVVQAVYTEELALRDKIRCYFANKQWTYSLTFAGVALCIGIEYIRNVDYITFTFFMISTMLVFVPLTTSNLLKDISIGGSKIGIPNNPKTPQNKFTSTIPGFIAGNIAALIGYASIYKNMQFITIEAIMLCVMVVALNLSFIFGLLFNSNTTIKRNVIPFTSLMVLFSIPIIQFLTGNYNMLSVSGFVIFSPIVLLLFIFYISKKHNGIRFFSFGLVAYFLAYALEISNLNNLQYSDSKFIQNAISIILQEESMVKPYEYSLIKPPIS